jgi:hypothetical protein
MLDSNPIEPPWEILVKKQLSFALVLVMLGSCLLIASCRTRETSNPFSGTDFGMGGRVIECEGDQPRPGYPKIVPTEVHENMRVTFDAAMPEPMKPYFEVGKYFSDYHDFGPDNSTYVEKALAINDRLEKLDPVRHQLFKKWILTFDAEKYELARDLDTLGLTPDGDIVDPAPGCEQHLLIAQHEPKTSTGALPIERARYVIDKELWNDMDDNGKAVMVLHEVVYRYARPLQHMTSSNIRFYLRKLLINWWRGVDQKQYFEEVKGKDYGLPGYVDVIGLQVDGTSIVVQDDGVIKGSILPQDRWKDEEGNLVADWRDFMGNIYEFPLIDGKAATIKIVGDKVFVSGNFLARQDLPGDVSETYMSLKMSNYKPGEEEVGRYAATSISGRRGYELTFNGMRKIIGGYRAHGPTGENDDSWGFSLYAGRNNVFYWADKFEADTEGHFTKLYRTYMNLHIFDERIWHGDAKPDDSELHTSVRTEDDIDLDLYPSGIPKSIKVKDSSNHTGHQDDPLFLKINGGQRVPIKPGITIFFEPDGSVSRVEQP